jgi:hypothetical protein
MDNSMISRTRGLPKWVRWGLLAGLLTGCIGTLSSRPRGVPLGSAIRPGEAVVQLRQATLPSALGLVAVHYWFAVFEPERGDWSRWEVWQTGGMVATSWGHVHKDLMAPDSGVGGGPFRIAAEWRGDKARDLLAVLNRPDDYPYRNVYRAWPGPNSNTYAAWVLKQARVACDLHPMAIGKDYCGLIGGGLSSTRTGFQGETPLVGLKLGLKDGVELHALCLTFGVDLFPPALKTPFGRLGLAESCQPR